MYRNLSFPINRHSLKDPSKAKLLRSHSSTVLLSDDLHNEVPHYVLLFMGTGLAYSPAKYNSYSLK